MRQDSKEPQATLIGRGQDLVVGLLRKLPRGLTFFWIRFLGVFMSRRMSMMAAVSAFWAIFAFPWLLIVLIFISSSISQLLGNNAVEVVQEAIINSANRFLTPDAAQQFAIPILDSLFKEGMTGLGIIGVVVALWSGSKAALSLMDAITFIEDNIAPAGYLTRRFLALGMLLGGIVAVAITLPLVVVGPKQLGDWLNLSANVVLLIVIGLGAVLGVLFLLLLYKTATMHFRHWDTYIPGAVLATGVSLIGIVGLAMYVRQMFENNAFLGALLTPIVMMTTAYVLCLIVLAGAVFNYVKSLGPKVDESLTPAMIGLLTQVQEDTNLLRESSGEGFTS